MFPIKYIDNNLVWNKDNEVFADVYKRQEPYTAGTAEKIGLLDRFLL